MALRVAFRNLQREDRAGSIIGPGCWLVSDECARNSNGKGAHRIPRAQLASWGPLEACLRALYQEPGPNNPHWIPTRRICPTQPRLRPRRLHLRSFLQVDSVAVLLRRRGKLVYWTGRRRVSRISPSGALEIEPHRPRDCFCSPQRPFLGDLD